MGFKGSTLYVVLAIFMLSCGPATIAYPDQSSSNTAANAAKTDNFAGAVFPFTPTADLGDHFSWGKFIRAPYQTTAIRELPIPVYPAYFSAAEEAEIRAGIELANDAIGFEMFLMVATWSPDARVIYKVHKIYFDDENFSTSDFSEVIGYTYSRNVYIDDKYEAGRVVTDWAMEIREDRVEALVVAHELGHAMGIQKHALIDYENDTLLPMDSDSLMSAVINANPSFDDYDYMMFMQGEILLDYLAR